MTQNFLYIFPIVNVYNEHIKIKGQLRLREKKTCYTFFIKIQKSFFYFISIKLMIIWKELDKHHWHWKKGRSEVARVFFRSWGWVAKKMKPHFKKSLSEFFFKPAKFKKKNRRFRRWWLRSRRPRWSSSASTPCPGCLFASQDPSGTQKWISYRRKFLRDGT